MSKKTFSIIVSILLFGIMAWLYPIMCHKKKIDEKIHASRIAHEIVNRFVGGDNHIAKDICPICNPMTYYFTANNNYWKINIFKTKNDWR